MYKLPGFPGPIWNNEDPYTSIDKSIGQSCPCPNLGGGGPVLLQPDSFAYKFDECILSKRTLQNKQESREETLSHHSFSEDSDAGQYDVTFTPRFTESQKWQIVPVLPCTVPVGCTVHSWEPTSTTSPSSKVPWGNRLHSLQTDQCNLLLHIANNSLKTEIILSSATEEPKTESLKYTKLTSIKPSELNGISDIVSKCVYNNHIVLIWNLKSVSVYKAQDSELTRWTNCMQTNIKHCVTGADVSDVLTGYWLLAAEDGTVCAYDGNQKVWCRTLSEASTQEWYGVKFGHHPCTVLAANKDNLWQGDIRAPQQAALNSLFELNKYKKYIANDTLCSYTKSCYFPYLYAITQENVLLIDERQTKVPILSWKHLLRNSPTFTLVDRNDDTDILILGDSVEKKISFISTKMLQCIDKSHTVHSSVALPRHFSINSDMLNFAHKKKLWFDNKVLQRLQSEWTGIACCKFDASNNDRFTIVTLNAASDMYCQKFIVRQAGDNSEAVEGTDVLKENIAERLSHWESEVINKSLQPYKGEKCDVSKSLAQIAKSSTPRRVQSRYILNEGEWNVRATVEEKNKALVKTKTKSLSWNRDWQHTFLQHYILDSSNDQCSDGGMYTLQNGMINSGNEFEPPVKKYLATKVSSQLCYKQLSVCKDDLSKVILEILAGSSDEMDSGRSRLNFPCPKDRFYCAPFNTVALSCHPKKLATFHTNSRFSKEAQVVKDTDTTILSESVLPQIQSTSNETPANKKCTPKRASQKIPSQRSSTKKRQIDGF